MAIGAAAVISIAFMYRASGCYITLYDPTGDEIFGGSAGKETSVHFIDVGQGDSILICGSEKNVLIDGGERDQGSVVLEALADNGVETLHSVIVTHPHSDHIGGLVDVLEYAASYDDLEVRQVVMAPIPDSDTPTTSVYYDFLSAVELNEIGITMAELGDTMDIGSGIITLYPPYEDGNYDSLNDYSLCAHLECNNTSFFFAGDMETPEEYDMLDYGYLDDVTADVLKAGHHGSGTSSSRELLNQLEPQYVVISCGDNNSYGHPHKEALDRFNKYADEIFRTDKSGTITCVTNGKRIRWTTEEEE